MCEQHIPTLFFLQELKLSLREMKNIQWYTKNIPTRERPLGVGSCGRLVSLLLRAKFG